MKALSMDLRERIVAVYLNKEGSHVVLAKRFRVSPCTVGKLVRQLRERGTLEPQVHLRGRKPAVRGEKEEELRQHLQEHPDATLQERIDALGLKCSQKTMWMTLRRLGWRFKKKHRERPSKTEKTSLSSAPTGVIPSQRSIPSDSCSSTKPV